MAGIISSGRSILAALFLCCCVSPSDASPQVAGRGLIAPGAYFVFPRPAAFGRSAEIQQVVSMRQGEKTISFEARLSIKPGALKFVAIDSLGRRALTLNWNGSRLAVEKAAWLPVAVRPDCLAADIVAVYWPRLSVRAGLANIGGSVNDSIRTRTIKVGQTKILAAEYGWNAGAPLTGTLHYKNFGWNYDVDVRSVELGR